jgi:hypothetical protein
VARAQPNNLSLVWMGVRGQGSQPTPSRQEESAQSTHSTKVEAASRARPDARGCHRRSSGRTRAAAAARRHRAPACVHPIIISPSDVAHKGGALRYIYRGEPKAGRGWPVTRLINWLAGWLAGWRPGWLAVLAGGLAGGVAVLAGWLGEIHYHRGLAHAESTRASYAPTRGASTQRSGSRPAWRQKPSERSTIHASPGPATHAAATDHTPRHGRCNAPPRAIRVRVKIMRLIMIRTG